MIIIENKNTFEDLLGLEIETEDKFLNKKLNSHVCYSGGGGGGSKQQDIAPTLQPYVRDVLSRAKGQVDAPYQAYPGERIVGFTPQELAAQQGIQQMAGQYGLAATAPGLTSSAAYYSPAYSYLGQTGQALGQQAGALAEAPRLFGTQEALYGEALRPISGIQEQLTGAGRLLGESGLRQRAAARDIGRDEIGRFALTGEDIQEYMDPYQQAVVDIEKAQARQDALQTAQAIAAKSAGMGAFGGSRQAILESQAASDLAKRLSDIQTRGSQAAYQQALQTAAQQQQIGLTQAERQRAREQQLGAGLAGLASARQQLGVGGYGSMAEQLRQAGAGFGSLGGQYGSLAGQFGQLGGGLGALSGQYGSLGQQALGQGYRELGYLSGVGEAQRGLGQERADVAYGDFREAREYPMQQLERYAGMAFGVPSGYIQGMQAQPSRFQQAVGGVTTAAGLGRGLGFFNQGGNIGNRGLNGAIQALSGGQIQALLEEKKKLEAEIKTLNASTKRNRVPAGSIQLKNKLDKINATLQAESQNLAKPPSSFGGRPSPGSQKVKPAPFQLPPSGLVQTGGSGQQPPSGGQQPPSGGQQPPQLSPYETVIQDLGERFGGLGTTEAQKQGLAAYAELAKLIGEDKFDKEAREAEIQEQIKAARSQGGFDVAALGVEIMSKPLAEIDNDLIRNLGTSKKEIAALKAEINKLPAEERAQGIKNALTKITALGSIQDLIPDVLEAPDASPTVVLGALELATQGMGKSFSQNQLEKEGIKVGKLATDVLEDIDALQIKDDNTRNQAYVEALAQKLRDEMRKKGLLPNVVTGGGSGTGGGGGAGSNQGNQGQFIPPPVS
tara:strand:+ start:3806 stop:6325 length:2520 start_codon:yes stop_codon:yes gene_type:complete